jgi:hypothetical protein
MTVLLISLGVYSTLAVATCALVGARRAKLRRGTDPHFDLGRRPLEHRSGYDGALLPGSERRAGAWRR